MKDVTKLTVVIGLMHDCEASYAGSKPVKEVFQGKTAWDGEVEIFDIKGHPKAKRCYAWAYVDDDGKNQYTTVLEIPPVDSPEMAVRASIASGN